MKTEFDFSGLQQFKPLDETEAVNLAVTDDILKTAKIAAYNVGQVVNKDDNDGKGPKEVPARMVFMFIKHSRCFLPREKAKS